MNKKLYEALEVCLQALETGASIESVLKRYPQMADELRPILEASVRAQSLAAPSVPEGVMQRGRARVLGHAAEMRALTRGPRRSMFSFPRLATSLALALIFVLSGTGLVRAASGALPGDNLYPVKRTWEDIRLLLAFSSEGREVLEDEFEQERVNEVDELLAEGRHETISFAGLVTEQDGDYWVVSGIPVQITPNSKLPVEPVTLGASVVVKGRTNLQGFVEAERIDLLEPGISLPPFEPVEIEDPELENNSNDGEIEEKIESPTETVENENDSDGNGNDDSDDDNDNDDDNSNDNDDDSNDNDDDSNDNDNDDDNNKGNDDDDDDNNKGNDNDDDDDD